MSHLPPMGVKSVPRMYLCSAEPCYVTVNLYLPSPSFQHPCIKNLTYRSNVTPDTCNFCNLEIEAGSLQVPGRHWLPNRTLSQRVNKEINRPYKNKLRVIPPLTLILLDTVSAPTVNKTQKIPRKNL